MTARNVSRPIVYGSLVGGVLGSLVMFVFGSSPNGHSPPDTRRRHADLELSTSPPTPRRWDDDWQLNGRTRPASRIFRSLRPARRAGRRLRKMRRAREAVPLATNHRSTGINPAVALTVRGLHGGPLRHYARERAGEPVGSRAGHAKVGHGVDQARDHDDFQCAGPPAIRASSIRSGARMPFRRSR